MKIIILIAIIFLLVPIPIYFFICGNYLQIYFWKIKWHQLTKKQKKTKISKKHPFHWHYLKAVRIKKLKLKLGYQCEMIDDSIYLYDVGLVFFPTVIAILKNFNVSLDVQLQYFPVIKSEVKGMITISLARLILEIIQGGRKK